ncbi:hypothetical protein CK203_117246 [Vitis vinifera]|uniref:Uncharacterized protein n=1 Tax=Vitis vinifera TaxID=29760 RepID=A0A438C8M9_VITVI|nr:hypothetical protein CK203_117246 [Vitis vinifera]
MESVGGLFCTSKSPPMVAPPVPPQPEQGKLPTETAPPVPTPEAISTAPPTTPIVPPVAPTTSEPSITISASEFRALDQQTAILRQIQQHLGLLSPPQPDLPTSSRPLTIAEDTISLEDTTTIEVRILPPQEATIATSEDASFPQAPTTYHKTSLYLIVFTYYITRDLSLF